MEIILASFNLDFFNITILFCEFNICRGSTTGFHLLWHTVELAMSTRLCLL